jgi:protein-S-isoprenylcysteine O-methyltransferase Ste14
LDVLYVELSHRNSIVLTVAERRREKSHFFPKFRKKLTQAEKMKVSPILLLVLLLLLALTIPTFAKSNVALATPAFGLKGAKSNVSPVGFVANGWLVFVIGMLIRFRLDSNETDFPFFSLDFSKRTRIMR